MGLPLRAVLAGMIGIAAPDHTRRELICDGVDGLSFARGDVAELVAVLQRLRGEPVCEQPARRWPPDRLWRIARAR